MKAQGGSLFGLEFYENGKQSQKMCGEGCHINLLGLCNIVGPFCIVPLKQSKFSNRAVIMHQITKAIKNLLLAF